MAKDKGDRIPTREIAKVAQKLALESSASTAVQGIMLEAVIRILFEKGLLSKADLETLFFHADSLVKRDALGSSEEVIGEIARAMRRVIERVASTFGVDLEALRKTDAALRGQRH